MRVAAYPELHTPAASRSAAGWAAAVGGGGYRGPQTAGGTMIGVGAVAG